ncbi:MAG: hypothetical protein FJ291_16350 [Planctomycetes bacterium]|nr:hypothetical protein [Planctomycetota bacterium]
MLRAWLVSVLAMAIVLVGCTGGPAKAEPKKAPGTVEIRVPVAEKKPAAEPAEKPETKPAGAPEAKPDEAKPALKELKPGLLAVDLSKLVNNDGFSDDTDRKDSDLDQYKQSFPAENMPKAGLFEPKDVKAAFDFPSTEKEKKNNVACAGQTIPLEGKAKELQILATATDADQQEKLTINYADGTVQADLKVTDWCKDAQFGEKTGVESAQRIAVDAGGKGEFSKEDKKCRIWVVTIPLDANRELKSVKLPFCSLIHIFALTVAR